MTERPSPAGPRSSRFCVSDVGLAPGTTNGHLRTLRKLLQTAVDWGRLPAVPKFKLLRQPPQRFAFLTPEECARLLAHPRDKMCREMVLLALRTGMRIGEIVALDWRDVDLDRRLLAVRQGISGGVLTSPKNNKVRHIPLAHDISELLGRRRQEEGFLFSVRRGRPLATGCAGQRLRDLCDRLGMRRVGWHALRHTFCSQLVQRSVPLPAVQALLGHADLRMTLRYSHLAPSTLRDAIAVLEQPTSPVGPPAVNAPPRAPKPSGPILRATQPISEDATVAPTA